MIKLTFSFCLVFLAAACSNSSVLRRIETNNAPKAIGPYSQAITSDDTVFCSGQIAIDASTGKMSSGDIRQQTKLVLHNLAMVLAAEGLTLNNVVKTTVYMADLKDFTSMNEVYASFFEENKPARATVEVAQLPKGALVEIDCIAVR